MRLLFTALACLLSFSVLGQIAFENTLKDIVCRCNNFLIDNEIDDCYKSMKSASSLVAVMSMTKNQIIEKLLIEKNELYEWKDVKILSDKYYYSDVSEQFYNCRCATSNKSGPTISENNDEVGDIIFNKVPRDFIIERVFVVPVESIDCNGVDSGAKLALATEAILLSKYDILERRHFEDVLNEQRLAASGLLLEETAVELGCNIGSQGIIFVETGCFNGKETTSIKLVDCMTSEAHWSCYGVNVSSFSVLNKIVVGLDN